MSVRWAVCRVHLEGSSPVLYRSCSTLALAAAIVCAPPAAAEIGDAEALGEIVVTAPDLRGSVESAIEAEIKLEPADIESYGASSVAELLTALAPQTGSARGRGAGGPPVVLLNGRRISGFGEIRTLPPEAIRKVEIFPEELALQYGFAADQRVVNLILKDGFKSVALETGAGTGGDGAFFEGGAEGNLLRIGPRGRLSITAEYTDIGAVAEAERGIVSEPGAAAPYSFAGNVLAAPLAPGTEISPALSALAGQLVSVAAVPEGQAGILTLPALAATAGRPGFADPAAARTLAPASQELQLGLNANRQVSAATSITLDLRYATYDAQALLGLPRAIVTVPATSPFSQLGTDVTLLRAFVALPPLRRDTARETARAAFTLDGTLARWQWTLTAAYDQVDTDIRTASGVDVAALQAGIDAGRVNPFGPESTLDLTPGFVATARSRASQIETVFNANGPVAELPAGTLRGSYRIGYLDRMIESETDQPLAFAQSRLGRDDLTVRATLDIPLASRRKAVAAPLGNLSVNVNATATRLSDFGSLAGYGFGLNWSPVEGLSLLASFDSVDAAPTIQQLGDPLLATPGVPVFDYARGETAIVTHTAGGNPALLAEHRRDIKLTMSLSPRKIEGLTLTASYVRNRSTSPIAGFPALTPEIEAAFPGRFVRDAAGRLVAVDARAVNFAETRSDVMRWGMSFSRPIGRQPPGAGGLGRGPGGGGFGRGPMAGMFGGGGGRWNIALYHSVRFSDEVLVAPGLAPLDLLGGDAIGDDGGASRHSVELEGGWFHRGLGARLSGTYLSGSTVDGSGTASALDFSDVLTLNLRLFFNADARPGLVKGAPFLKGTRFSLRVDNLTDSARRVTDASGAVPLPYQKGYLVPRGRYIELGFRKAF
jgi:hypothetical protein